MKKLFLSLLFVFIFAELSVFAEKMPNLKYKNIGDKDKISYDVQTDTWSHKIDKKNKNYFIKTKGFGEFYDYLDSSKNFAFSTNCEYEFIYNNSLIGYSNKDMKFYDISYTNGGVGKRALSKEEVEKIFPDYELISLSDFSNLTNSKKVKKGFGDLKIILFNDTDKTFENYKFTSGNAKFEQYDLRGFLTVTKHGMIQFAPLEESENSIWYVILVR